MALLWSLRAVWVIGIFTLLVGSPEWRSYGASCVLASMGVGSMSLVTASWSGAGIREIVFGKVLVVVFGLALLGAAVTVAVLKCGVPRLG